MRRYALDSLLSPGLLGELRPTRFSAGEFIIRSGEPAERLMFFVEGRAKVYSLMENGSSLLVRFYRPLEVIGEVELFAYDRYILNVQAMSEVVCLCVQAPRVRQAAADNVQLLTRLCASLGKKLASFNTTSAINLRYPLRNRLASYLLALAETEPGASTEGLSRSEAGDEAGKEEEADRLDERYATDRLGELADLLGTSYRNLSRAVREFRDRGLLEATRGRIRVTDREGLRELARDIYR